MKLKKFVAAGVVGMMLSSMGFAGGFDGPFVQLGVGGSATSTSVSGSSLGTGNSTDGRFNQSGTQGNFNGLASLGYSKSFDDFNLATNIFYVIGNQNAGSMTSSATTEAGYPAALSQSYKLQNTFGLSIEPGWNFTNETLGYLKFAWVNARAKEAMNVNAPAVYTGGFANASKAINGFGYGIGAKHLLTENIYAAVDLMGVTYGSYSGTVNSVLDCPTCSAGSSKTQQFIGTVSLGYKF